MSGIVRVVGGSHSVEGGAVGGSSTGVITGGAGLSTSVGTGVGPWLVGVQ